MNTEVRQFIQEAKTLLARLNEGSTASDSATADDLLLFCYRLRDGYHIMRSSSKQFPGPTFSSLNGLLYELESKPHETMQSSEWRSVIENLLQDLASGAIIVECASASPRHSHRS